MSKFVCKICGWVYDEEAGAPNQGIEPGTKHAYIIFAKVARQFFLLGVSLALYSMGYKYEKSFLK